MYNQKRNLKVNQIYSESLKNKKKLILEGKQLAEHIGEVNIREGVCFIN